MKTRNIAKSKVGLKLREITSSRGTSKGKEKASAQVDWDIITDQWAGHYFEVLRGIALERESVRPGAIKPGGKVWAKLSSVRERRLFRDLYYDGSGDDEPDEDHPNPRADGHSPASRASTPPFGPVDACSVDHDLRPDPLDEDEPADPSEGEWHWEGEDDLTMGKVWPKGPDLTRGFIYVRLPSS